MYAGRIDCLQVTYGRHSRVEESLACFLRFDYPNRHLYILNAHECPLQFNHPLVTVINEPGRHPTLGHCRNRLLDFAQGEFAVIYDDDDLWLPHFLSTAVQRIGDGVAWKSARSWWCNGPDKFDLAANAMEASILWKTAFLRSIRWHTGQGDESKTLMAALGNAGPKQDELGIWSPYLYRFGCGEWHASGTIGDGRPDATRSAEWRRMNNDVRDSPLVPAFDRVFNVWRRLVRCLHPSDQSNWMTAAMGHGPAHAAAIAMFPPKVLTVANRKPHGGRLVVAPGCWDGGLHPGHVEFLRWARTQGDALAVLVNSDAGVTAQKGTDRPLVPLAGRIAALTANESVSAIFVVDGADDLPVLTALTPAVLCKGPDYIGRESSVPRPPGCEVRAMPPSLSSFPHHTTDLIHAAA